MEIELRKTGISVVGDVPWGTHFCHFYETKQDLLDTLVPYFKAGLESKEYCLWVVSNSEIITVEEAKAGLEQAVPDLDRHLSEESIEIINGLDWYLEENVFNLERVMGAWDAKLKRALALGYDGMRVSGDTFWLAETDWKDFFAYEKQLNESITDQPMTVLCTYPLAKSRAAEVLDVVQAHQFAIARRQGEWEVIETPALNQAKAEIERLNQDLEQRVIERTREVSVTNEALRREIVQRQQAEDRIRLIIDAIPTMAWSLGPDGVVDFLNQRWVDYTGLSLERFNEEPSRPIHPEDIPGVTERWRAEMAAGEPYDDELRLQRSDGEYRWFLVRNAPLHDERGNLVRWYGVAIDIEDRKQAEEKLKQSQERLRATTEQLRALSASLQSAREEEATRIAREIHDELGAALSSLRWDLEDFDEAISETQDQSQLQELRKKIEAMMRLTDTTINTVRRIASELRPIALDALGLSEAIEWQARQFQDRTGIIVHLDCALENLDLNRERSTAVFRIFQEALTNILRHAQATSVNVQISAEEGEFILTISDNGRGITDDEKSGQHTLGLLGMRERAHLIRGKIDITGSNGKGTLISLRFPLAG